MPALDDEIRAVAQRRRDPMIADLRDLVRAGKSGEAGIQRHVAAAAVRLGGIVETVAYEPSAVPMVGEFASHGAIDAGQRACLVARWPGNGGGRSLLVFAHPDSEPFTGGERWRHDPFAGHVEGGRLYGWGVADDVAGVAIMLAGLDLVRASGLTLRGDLVLALTPSKRHARGVSALLHRGLTADGALYVHPAESGCGLGEIKAFASGQIEFRIRVEGRPPDTTEPHQTGFAHQAVNPIEKAMLVVAALMALDLRRGATVHDPALHAAVGRSTNLMISHIASGDPSRLSRAADTCTVGAALAFPPSETLDGIKAAITGAVMEACARDPWLADHPAEIAWDAGVSGAAVSPEHPLYRVAAEAVRAITGASPHINPMHTSSDIRNPIVQSGIPTIGFGPLCGDLSQNGGHDEWVDVEDYVRAVTVVAGVFAGWCGTRDG